MRYSIDARRVQSISAEHYVAPSAELIGDVILGHRTTVWFNCILRADDDRIVIGDGSNVQDASIIHVDDGMPVIIGDNSSVGHGVIVHGCTIGDETLIGNGAIVLDAARIGNRCLIAAGSLVPPNMHIPDGSVLMGAPARIVRQTSEKDLKLILRAAEHYQTMCARYTTQLRPDAIA